MFRRSAQKQGNVLVSVVFAYVALQKFVGAVRAHEWPLMKTNGSLAVTKAPLILAVKTVVTPQPLRQAGGGSGVVGLGSQWTELSAEGLEVD